MDDGLRRSSQPIRIANENAPLEKLIDRGGAVPDADVGIYTC